jgi:hypothetical protein
VVGRSKGVPHGHRHGQVAKLPGLVDYAKGVESINTARPTQQDRNRATPPEGTAKLISWI